MMDDGGGDYLMLRMMTMVMMMSTPIMMVVCPTSFRGLSANFPRLSEGRVSVLALTSYNKMFFA